VEFADVFPPKQRRFHQSHLRASLQTERSLFPYPVNEQLTHKASMMKTIAICVTLIQLLLAVGSTTAFSFVAPSSTRMVAPAPAFVADPLRHSPRARSTQLYMSDRQRSKSTKKGVKTITKDGTETKAEEDKKKEEMWRVVLHNDEVHTFHYVVRSLTKVIGTLDRKAAFEVCVQTHGIGKSTITKTWKKQAEQYCLGLQRQGLTVSIAPDEDFEGGHSGGNV
jgi:ATP-dependent Clp protease adapter protein ClpS